VQFDGFTYEGNFCKSQGWVQMEVYGEIQEQQNPEHHQTF